METRLLSFACGATRHVELLAAQPRIPLGREPFQRKLDISDGKMAFDRSAIGADANFNRLRRVVMSEPKGRVENALRLGDHTGAGQERPRVYLN